MNDRWMGKRVFVVVVVVADTVVVVVKRIREGLYSLCHPHHSSLFRDSFRPPPNSYDWWGVAGRRQEP